MANPTVSVIIPCYNSEATVGETLRSLQNQTFRHWEAIVVNDGSTDGSAKIIRHYQASDSRIQQIDQENQGLPEARNAGLAMAKGEFIHFLDADDLILPNMLQRMVRAFNRKASVGAVHCGWIYGDAGLQDLSWVVPPGLEEKPFLQMGHGYCPPCHSILIRRGILEKVGLFDVTLRHCHDWDFWLRVARFGTRFARVRDPLVIYRMMRRTLSRNPSTFFQAGRQVIRVAHSSDTRVKTPDAKFAKGCGCAMQEITLHWLIYCVGFAIAKGDPVQASELFETTIVEENLQVSPSDMYAMTNAIWIGSAIPKGRWDLLLPHVSTALLQFLIREEEHLGIPGFTILSMLEIAGLRELQRKANLDNVSANKLLRALKKKILWRLFRL